MAFPTLAAGNMSTELVATTSHSMDLPLTVNAGELLLTKVSSGGEPVITMPDGWELTYIPTTFSAVSLACFKKIADGTEGGTSVAFPTDIAVKSSHLACAITGWSGDLSGVVAAQNAVTANSATPNPPGVTAPWGVADNMYLAQTSMQRTAALTGYPTNYLDNQAEISTGSAGQDSIVAMATRELAAASDDPNNFTAATARRNISQTLVIAPAGTTIPAYRNMGDWIREFGAGGPVNEAWMTYMREQGAVGVTFNELMYNWLGLWGYKQVDLSSRVASWSAVNLQQ